MSEVVYNEWNFFFLADYSPTKVTGQLNIYFVESVI